MERHLSKELVSMKRVAVLTSGGDAPGMNAAIRAMTRTALHYGWSVVGVRQGYLGLMNGDYRDLTSRDVAGIIQSGGTILGSARATEFKTEAGQKRAIAMMQEHGIEGLFVIGGNGSQTGAYELHKHGFPVVGIASTIDNDLIGSDVTIGVDTALNIALESIDRLKVTAASHERAFLVEVMGRNCGYLALMAGIAGGAEAICIPEIETKPEEIAQTLIDAKQRGKSHGLVVVAEGAKFGAPELLAYFGEHKKQIGFDLRATQLGHVQRGGAPTAFDRTLATRLGAYAVKCMLEGKSGVVAGLIGSKLTTTPHAEVVGRTKSISPELYELAGILSM
jgi:6-phosphofructokinase 1